MNVMTDSGRPETGRERFTAQELAAQAERYGDWRMTNCGNLATSEMLAQAAEDCAVLERLEEIAGGEVIRLIAHWREDVRRG